MTNWSKIGGINAIACKVSVATDRLRAGMTEPQPRTPKASNNSRPKWPFAYRQIYKICMYQNDAAGLRRSQT
ncbi:hypothetical protein [Fibrobacter intestinalis]|nr:hypothetical protein [Fibrobacter intestinalis]